MQLVSTGFLYEIQEHWEVRKSQSVFGYYLVKCISQHVIGSHIRYDNACVNSAWCTIYLTSGFRT